MIEWNGADPRECEWAERELRERDLTRRMLSQGTGKRMCRVPLLSFFDREAIEADDHRVQLVRILTLGGGWDATPGAESLIVPDGGELTLRDRGGEIVIERWEEAP
jgi:hypothetical protein